MQWLAHFVTLISEKEGRLYVDVHVVPGSKKSQVSGQHGERLKLKIASPPVDGKANEEIIGFFAKLLEIPKRNIEIVRGELSREKTLSIVGVSLDRFLSITQNKG